MISTDILIIGGGLSGLALADHLQQSGADYHLVEARQRFGGRIKVLHSAGGKIDLGPSWFWPGQPRIDVLARRFDLKVFEQFATGELSYENERGEVLRNQGWASMQGSLRIEGGMVRLIDALLTQLPEGKLTKSQPIVRLVHAGNSIEVFGQNGELVARADKIALAFPPRIASKLKFEPALSEASLHGMQTTPTWMAGHAKFVAVYDTPFWRANGLSGDAMSRYGPMIEIHDASDPQQRAGGLFGFLGVPAVARAGQHDAIVDACVAQLTRIFGSQAQSPVETFLQDWAFEPETAIEADHAPPAQHPHYGLPSSLSELWDGKLLLCSTEVAPQFGGFLEGALEAAENVLRLLNAGRSSNSD